MTEALAETAQAQPAHSARPAPFAAENGVVHWLQLGGKVTLPEVLPDMSVTRLQDLYPDAADPEMPIEDLLRRVDADIRALPSSRITDAQRYIAGFSPKALKVVAPEYGRAVLALRRQVSKRLAAVAITAVDTTDPVAVERTSVQGGEESLVRSLVRQSESEDHDTSDPDISVVSSPDVPEATAIFEEPEPATEPEAEEHQRWIRRLHEALHLVLAQRDVVVSDTAEEAATSQAEEIPASPESVQDEALSQEPLSEESTPQPDGEQTQETAGLGRDIVQTLEFAQQLLGQRLSPEYAEVLKKFVEGQCFELYRLSRLIKPNRTSTIEPTLVSIARFMNGEDPADIQATCGLGPAMKHKVIRTRFVRRLQLHITGDDLAHAFAEFIESGTSSIEGVLAELKNRKVGQAVLAKVEKKPRKITPKPAPTPEDEAYTVTARSRPASHADIVRVTVSEPDEGDWHERALCAQTDPEIFFPEQGGSTKEAKKICSGCEVRAECLAYALKHEERFGVWGGLGERQRRRLKRVATVSGQETEAALESLPLLAREPDARVRQLVDILSTPSDTETDEIEHGLRKDTPRLRRFVQAMLGWYADSSGCKMESTTVHNLSAYFTGEAMTEVLNNGRVHGQFRRGLAAFANTVDAADWTDDPLQRFWGVSAAADDEARLSA